MRKVTGLLAAAACVAVAFGSVVQAVERVDRTSKDVSFRLISDTERDGFSAIRSRGSGTTYVSSESILTESHIVSVTPVDRGLELTLTDEGVQKLRDAGIERLAIVQANRLIATPTVEALTGNAVRISDLSAGQVNRLSRIIQTRDAAPISAVMQVVPEQSSIRPGDVVTVDVYLSGATNVRTYQVALDAVGGDSGSLTRQEAWIDTDRTDYLFGTAEVIQAVDDVHGRMGALLFDEAGVDAMTPVYLGTATFQASDDASGDFTVVPRVTSGDTLLTNPTHTRLQFRVQGATIQVGQ